MAKTCATCDWFRSDAGRAKGFCTKEPAILDVNSVGLCSHWKSKLERKCKNCDFYFAEDSPRLGTCRAKAPVFIPGMNEARFPKVPEDYFCGEFRGRE